MERSNLTEVTCLTHELLRPYLKLRTTNWTRYSGILIAEGPLVVERLIRSDHQIESILLDRRYYDSFIGRIPETVPVIVVDHSLVVEIVGFNFHRGVLACGKRKPLRHLSDETRPLEFSEAWIGLIGVQDPENVGGILRSAAGLGIRRVLVGPGTADPLSRRALRVSMGNVLGLELYESSRPLDDIAVMKQLGVEIVATSLSSDSIPLETSSRNGPMVILVGNEKHGLPAEILAQVDRRVKIDMCQNTDSLNVSVAAAITMYHFMRLCV